MPQSVLLSAPAPVRTMMRTSFLPLVALAGILVIAGGLRFSQIGRQSLWLDELMTLVASAGHFGDIRLPPDRLIEPPPDFTGSMNARPWWAVFTLEQAKGDVHPPLFYIALHFWRAAFGDGDAAARALSVVFSLIALLMLFDAGRLLFGAPAALFAGLLMALSPLQVFYAQEVRSYSLLMAAGAGACSALLRIEKFGPSLVRAAWLMLCVLAMCLSHYFCFGAVIALAIYSLCRLRPRSLYYAAGAFAVAGVLVILLWGRQAMAQQNNAWKGFLVETGPPGLALLRVVLLPVRLLCGTVHERLGGGLVGILAGLGLWLAPLLAIRRKPELLLPWLWVAGVIGFVAVLDVTRKTHALSFVRYTLLASLGLYLLIGAAAARTAEVARRLIARPIELIPVLAIATGVVVAGFGYQNSTAQSRDANPMMTSLPWLALAACGVAVAAAAWRRGLAPAAVAWGLLSFLLLSLPNLYEPKGEEWRGLGEFIRQCDVPASAMVISLPGAEDWTPPIVYAGLSHYMYSRGRGVVFASRAPAGPLLDELRRRPAVWVISLSAAGAPQALFPGCRVRAAGAAAHVATATLITLPPPAP